MMKIDCICPPKGGVVRHPSTYGTRKDEQGKVITFIESGGDDITFRDALDFRAVAAIRWDVAIRQENDPGISNAEIFGGVTELYVLYGVESWSLVDDKGTPIEVNTGNIRRLLLPSRQAHLIGDEAERKYQPVMLPLLQGDSRSSPPTPTNESTSPKKDDSESPTPPEESSSSSSSQTPPKPSRRSSISTIPTAATAVTSTSLDGDSNSSQSSTSAA